ncbi:hypothetical protein FRC03_010248 [Tulasnella sp. 419]|nr:hypothetical protein FRC03_010248 [Tulasnella sp. 419]
MNNTCMGTSGSCTGVARDPLTLDTSTSFFIFVAVVIAFTLFGTFFTTSYLVFRACMPSSKPFITIIRTFLTLSRSPVTTRTHLIRIFDIPAVPVITRILNQAIHRPRSPASDLESGLSSYAYDSLENASIQGTSSSSSRVSTPESITIPTSILERNLSSPAYQACDHCQHALDIFIFPDPVTLSQGLHRPDFELEDGAILKNVRIGKVALSSFSNDESPIPGKAN